MTNWTTQFEVSVAANGWLVWTTVGGGRYAINKWHVFNEWKDVVRFLKSQLKLKEPNG